MTYTSHMGIDYAAANTNILCDGKFLTQGETIALLDQRDELLAACKMNIVLHKWLGVVHSKLPQDVQGELFEVGGEVWKATEAAVSNAEETK